MPYRTESGTHYHVTMGCSGAYIPCGTEGLAPCSICCGARRSYVAAGGTTASGDAGGAFLSAAQASPDAPVSRASGQPQIPDGGDILHPYDRRVTTVPEIRHEAAEDYVMRLADTLLAIKAGMDAVRDGQVASDSDLEGLASGALGDVLASLPEPTASSQPLPEVAVSPDDLVGDPLTPRQAFDARRHEEFLEAFRERTVDAIRRWDRDEWDRWRDANEGLAEYMKSNLWRERPPELSLFIDDEVESLLRRRYEDEVPCPSWRLAEQWQRHGRILTGGEDSWPGYAEALEEWDAESDRIWADRHETTT